MKNYIELEEACNHLWVTTEEIRIILGGVSKTTADKFRVDLEKKLDNEKINAEEISNSNEKDKALAQCFYFKNTKPHRLPIKRVLDEAHVDLDFVRREANKMRKALILENQITKKDCSI